ncbi:MAG: zinc ribbon domain-containing protein [Burkholderiaceae bacterium]
MPTYDFRCAECGDFPVMRPMSRRDEPCSCPRCGTAAVRVMISAPMYAGMDPGRRLAMATNEKARHAPVSSAEYKARHGAGCGCCGGRRASGTLTSPAGAKSFPGRRPWQISH